MEHMQSICKMITQFYNDMMFDDKIKNKVIIIGLSLSLILIFIMKYLSKLTEYKTLSRMRMNNIDDNVYIPYIEKRLFYHTMYRLKNMDVNETNDYIRKNMKTFQNAKKLVRELEDKINLDIELRRSPRINNKI